jgi:hypothetical protein
MADSFVDSASVPRAMDDNPEADELCPMEIEEIPSATEFHPMAVEK